MEKNALSGLDRVPRKTESWGLKRISNQISEYPKEAGEGVVVYVIDSGVNTALDEFEGRAEQGQTFCERCKDNQGNDAHGTKVASIIAGKTLGVAKKAKIVSVRISNDKGKSTNADLVGAIKWSKEHFMNLKKKNPHLKAIINRSGNGQFSLNVNQFLQEAVKEKGLYFVVAAGNDAIEYVQFAKYSTYIFEQIKLVFSFFQLKNTNYAHLKSACLQSPASSKHVIAVGATDIDDSFANFSNYGECVDILAPGVNVKAASHLDGGHVEVIGTSFAAPYVTGVAAVLLSQNRTRTYTHEELKKAILDHATEIPQENVKTLELTPEDEEDREYHVKNTNNLFYESSKAIKNGGPTTNKLVQIWVDNTQRLLRKKNAKRIFNKLTKQNSN